MAAMAERKTRATDADVDAFLDAVVSPTRRADAIAVRALMARATGEPATMWGPSIVGFGTHEYTLANGKPASICKVGFSPRAAATVLYLTDYAQKEEDLGWLGRHKAGAGCIYLPRLDDVDLAVLERMIERSYQA